LMRRDSSGNSRPHARYAWFQGRSDFRSQEPITVARPRRNSAGFCRLKQCALIRMLRKTEAVSTRRMAQARRGIYQSSSLPAERPPCSLSWTRHRFGRKEQGGEGAIPSEDWMSGFVTPIWNESDETVRGRLIALYAALIIANLLVWLWAFVALRGNAVLFGSAFLAYSFGLRHAVDADHIAAIDNSTRKLMQQGERPVGVGLFFSLGHSLVVFLLAVAVGFAASKVTSRFGELKAFGEV